MYVYAHLLCWFASLGVRWKYTGSVMSPRTFHDTRACTTLCALCACVPSSVLDTEGHDAASGSAGPPLCQCLQPGCPLGTALLAVGGTLRLAARPLLPPQRLPNVVRLAASLPLATLPTAQRLTQLMRCFARYLKWKDFSPERRAAGALVLFLVLRLRLPPHDRLCLRMNIHVYLGMCPGAACVCMEQGHMEQGHASPFVHSRDFRLRPAQAARQPPALQHKALALSRHPSAWTSLDDMCGCVQSHGQPFCLPTA